jgi:uncharacterized membrane protein YcaP (DUF421 family)
VTMWFQGWSDILRILLVGTAAYVALVLVLRVSGKRTLVKLNAFDLVVTVALGSTLATILLNASVSWSEGVVALALLAVLQFVVSFMNVRLPGTRTVVTAEPTLLVRNGVLVRKAMHDQRVPEAEVRQALRSSGVGSLDDVGAVVLETDGTLSVIQRSALGDEWALGGLEAWPTRSGDG